MTHDERVTGLINANSANVIKRRALAKMLRDIKFAQIPIIQAEIDKCLKDNGP